jgi:hypothetical protein
MKQYLEYFYLTGALALMVVYATLHKTLTTMEAYGLLGGILIFSFMYSIRRTMRRATEKHKTPSSDSSK